MITNKCEIVNAFHEHCICFFKKGNDHKTVYIRTSIDIEVVKDGKGY